jgi:3-isopropylmalate/(R)-2-methylmalate dehydratase large subunit
MSMTLTEKILARRAGQTQIAPGDNILVDVDVLMTHDVCGPGPSGCSSANSARPRGCGIAPGW